MSSTQPNDGPLLAVSSDLFGGRELGTRHNCSPADFGRRPPTDATRERHRFWHAKNKHMDLIPGPLATMHSATGRLFKFCLAQIGVDGRFEKAARKTHIIEFSSAEMAWNYQNN